MPMDAETLKNEGIGQRRFDFKNLSYIFVNKGYRMLEAGILNTLLIRMDLPYATQLHCAKPPNIPLEGEEYSWNVMLLITNVLWNLMKSVLPPKTLPENLKTLPSPKRCAMWYYLLINASIRWN